MLLLLLQPLYARPGRFLSSSSAAARRCRELVNVTWKGVSGATEQRLDYFSYGEGGGGEGTERKNTRRCLELVKDAGYS